MTHEWFRGLGAEEKIELRWECAALVCLGSTCF